MAYMKRAPPQALGSKPVPQGSPTCLDGLTFVLTGELECLTRDDLTDLIRRYGGRVTSAVSSKTDYLIVGRDAGQRKLDEAARHGTKQLDDDQLFALITERSRGVAAPSSKRPTPAPASPKARKATVAVPAADALRPDQLLVEKYRPRTRQDLVGNGTAIERIAAWLHDWDAIHLHGDRSVIAVRRESERAPRKNDPYLEYDRKAVLISGPPGIGKTSMARVLGEEAGREPIELNASDARSKSALQEHVSELLGSHSVTEYFRGARHAGAKATRPALLIMDEVDGMSAGDHGGVNELLRFIRLTRVPIVCICNESHLPKLRALRAACFNVALQRPTVQAVVGRLRTILLREHLDVSQNALEELIRAANCDIRQVLMSLSMWQLGQQHGQRLEYDESKAQAGRSAKDHVPTPFDAVRLLLDSREADRRTWDQLEDLFYADYDLVPLMVQENYLHCVPDQPRRLGSAAALVGLRSIELAAEVSDSVCESDLYSRKIRSEQQWHLLPEMAVSACVRPSVLYRGHMDWRINFPAWLGRNSQRNKYARMAGELLEHIRLHSDTQHDELLLTLLPALRTVLVEPMAQEQQAGIARVIDVMRGYSLLREDWDTILELATFPGLAKASAAVSASVKAAFTRQYKVLMPLLPYAVDATTRGRSRGTLLSAKTPERSRIDDGVIEDGAADDRDDVAVTDDADAEVATELP